MPWAWRSPMRMWARQCSGWRWQLGWVRRRVRKLQVDTGMGGVGERDVPDSCLQARLSLLPVFNVQARDHAEGLVCAYQHSLDA